MPVRFVAGVRFESVGYPVPPIMSSMCTFSLPKVLAAVREIERSGFRVSGQEVTAHTRKSYPGVWEDLIDEMREPSNLARQGQFWLNHRCLP
jgi:hypothetical protein